MERKRVGKILFVSTPKSWRGGEQQLVYLMEELASKKQSYTLICPEDSVISKVAKERGYDVAVFSKRGILNIKLALYIKRICRKQKYSIIHLNDSHAHTAAYLASLMGLKIPAVLHRRVIFPVKKNLFSEIKYNWDGIKAIICISSRVKEVLIPAIKSPQKIRVIFSGIDIRRFVNIEPKINLKATLGIPDDAVIIGNIAALSPDKDYTTFVRAAIEVVKENANVYFLAIGDGILKSEIHEMIEQSGYSNNIIITGFLEDIPGVLKQLDVFLITSKTEGLGTSILDAFAARVPVVATSAGGIPEMVLHEKTGLLAPVGNYKELGRFVNMIINDLELANRLVENASQKVMQFSKEKMASGVMEIYQQIET